DTGYIAKNSIWFTDESDLSVWKRVRQTFAPKDVKTYQQIILEERQAWQFSGPIKVKVISYWANQHEIHVKMLTEGRLADSEWWVEDKDYSNAARGPRLSVLWLHCMSGLLAQRSRGQGGSDVRSWRKRTFEHRTGTTEFDPLRT